VSASRVSFPCGPMTVTVPSFFAAATICSQDGGVCAVAVRETSNVKSNSAGEITAETQRTWSKKPIKKSSELGELCASGMKTRLAALGASSSTDGIFEIDRFLGIGLDRSRYRHSPRRMIGRHIQARADVPIHLCKTFLPLFGQQPVDVNLGRVLVRGSTEKSQTTGSRADVGAFLDLTWIQDRDGQTVLHPLLSDDVRNADQYRIFFPGDAVDLLRIVSQHRWLLLGQGANEIGTKLRMQVEKRKRGLARSRSGRIVHDNSLSIFGIEQIFVGFDFLRVDNFRIDEEGASLRQRHHQETLSRIDELESAAAPLLGILDF